MFEKKEEEEEGDQALAIKPFLGQVTHSKPSNYKESKNAGGVPEGNLTLKRAHGFRSHDTRDNARYVDGGKKVVFTTAALGVVQELKG